MGTPQRDLKAAIAEQYAAKAARAARLGHQRRAAELYRAALRALQGDEDGGAELSEYAFRHGAEEATSGIRIRGENDPPGTVASLQTDTDDASEQSA